MTANAPEAKLTVIRKLLAQAEDAAASPEEAATFTAKAAELMARYGVDRAMLADAGVTADSVGERTIELDPPYSVDKFDLLAGIGLALGLQVVRRTRYEGDRKLFTAVLFGFGSDLERTEILFTSLLLQAVRGLAAATVPSRENKAAYRRAWLAGFTSTIRARLLAAERQARETAEAEHPEAAAAGRSVAVVLADRERIVEERFAEAYPRLRTAPRRVLRGSGMGAGIAAGKRADLGQARLGARRGTLATRRS